ncbi:nuclear transport factor 2 family protein [Streptomyces sp. NPDC059989]|uniref:nuclear transport factor 2 family protein n=1 Tax=Streptomyces sp. NPDC059989 TaxID=3347026 RepID=UPI0036C9406D
MTNAMTNTTTAELDTAEVIRRFNRAFTGREPELLTELVAEDCVMVGVQPAPEGARYEGREACLEFWQNLAADRSTTFTPYEVFVAGDRAVIQWRAVFTDGEAVFGTGQETSVLGVNLMRIRAGRITEALGYAKTP